MNFIKKIRGYDALVAAIKDLRDIRLDLLEKRNAAMSRTIKMQKTLYTWLDKLSQTKLDGGPHDSGALYTLMILSSLGPTALMPDLKLPSVYGVMGANTTNYTGVLNDLVEVSPDENHADYLLYLTLGNREVLDEQGAVKPTIQPLISIMRWAQVVNFEVKIDNLLNCPSYLDMADHIRASSRSDFESCWSDFKEFWGLKGKEYRHLKKVVKRTTGSTALELFTAIFCNINATSSLLV